MLVHYLLLTWDSKNQRAQGNWDPTVFCFQQEKFRGTCLKLVLKHHSIKASYSTKKWNKKYFKHYCFNMAEEYSMSPRRLNNKTRLEFRCFRETLSRKTKKEKFQMSEDFSLHGSKWARKTSCTVQYLLFLYNQKWDIKKAAAAGYGNLTDKGLRVF